MEQNIYVAVDLGNSEIRMMAATRNEDGLLEILGVEKNPTPEGAIMHGIIKNPSDVSYNIIELAKKLSNRLEHHPVVTGFYTAYNGRTLRTTHGKLEKNFPTKIEITSQQLDEIEKEFKSKPVKDREIYDMCSDGYDLDDDFVRNPIGALCRHIVSNYLITYGLPDIRQNIDNVRAKLNSITIHDVSLAPVAIANAVATTDDKKNGCAVLNFGATTTSVAVYSDGHLRHMAVVPFGGQHITNDLCHFNLEQVLAEEAKKIKNVLQSSDATNRLQYRLKRGNYESMISMHDVSKAVVARLREIIQICLSEIGKSGCKDKLQSGLIVSGGCTRLDGFEAFLSAESKMPVRIGSYANNLSEASKASYSDTEYALLVGLLGHAQEPCTVVEDSLMNNERQVKKKKGFTTKMFDFFSGNDNTIEG